MSFQSLSTETLSGIVHELDGREDDHSNLALVSRHLHMVVQQNHDVAAKHVHLDSDEKATRWLEENDYRLELTKLNGRAAPVTFAQSLTIGAPMSKLHIQRVLKLASEHGINLRYVSLILRAGRGMSELLESCLPSITALIGKFAKLLIG